MAARAAAIEGRREAPPADRLPTLTEVVEFYYREAPTQGPDGLSLDVRPLLGQSFSEIPALVAFLESLTGEAVEVVEPELPR